MSIGSTHTISKLEKNSKAMDSQRLARVIAKKGKDGNYESSNLTESKCVSIPKIQSLSEAELKAMMPHIVGLIEGAQDGIIRELIVNEGKTSVHDSQISVGECIKYLDDSAKGNRITTEYMQKWFADTYYEPALEFICNVVCKFDPEKITTDQMTVMEQKSNVLRDMFAGFASPKYSPDIPKCKAMLRFGEYLTEENWDDRMTAMQQKVRKIKEEKEAELSMDALGFGD